MPTFSWTGRTLQGQQISGDLDAASKEEAMSLLAKREIAVRTIDQRASRGEHADPDRAIAHAAPRETSKEKPRPFRAVVFALVLVAAALGIGVWAPVVVYDCERTPGGIVNCVVHERALGLLTLRDQSIANVAAVESETRKAYEQVTGSASSTSRNVRSVSVDESRLILIGSNKSSIRPQSWISDGSLGSRTIDTRASIDAMILGVRTERVSNWQIPYIPMIFSGALVFVAVVFVGLAMLTSSPGFNGWMEQRLAEARERAAESRESRSR